MKPLRSLFSLLIFSIGISVCCATGNPLSETERSALDYHETHTVLALEDIRRFSPLDHQEGSLHFKASITILGEYYSGLVVIKEMPADSAVRVVFLSELGLTLMDMAYRNDEFEVVSIQEFLNRRSILTSLQNDFRCLLLNLSEIKKFSVYSSDDGLSDVLKFKHKKQRYRYSCHKITGPSAIRKKKGLFGRVDFLINEGVKAEPGEGEPLTIGIRHKGVRLNIDLIELKQL